MRSSTSPSAKRTADSYTYSYPRKEVFENLIFTGNPNDQNWAKSSTAYSYVPYSDASSQDNQQQQHQDQSHSGYGYGFSEHVKEETDAQATDSETRAPVRSAE